MYFSAFFFSSLALLSPMSPAFLASATSLTRSRPIFLARLDNAYKCAAAALEDVYEPSLAIPSIIAFKHLGLARI